MYIGSAQSMQFNVRVFVVASLLVVMAVLSGHSFLVWRTLSTATAGFRNLDASCPAERAQASTASAPSDALVGDQTGHQALSVVGASAVAHQGARPSRASGVQEERNVGLDIRLTELRGVAYGRCEVVRDTVIPLLESTARAKGLEVGMAVIGLMLSLASFLIVQGGGHRPLQ